MLQRKLRTSASSLGGGNSSGSGGAQQQQQQQGGVSRGGPRREVVAGAEYAELHDSYNGGGQTRARRVTAPCGAPVDAASQVRYNMHAMNPRYEPSLWILVPSPSRCTLPSALTLFPMHPA